MREQFYMVLCSNSSKVVFPENKTTRFNTLLPHNLSLPGDWSVAICEIQIPLTFQHISSDKKEDIVLLKKSKPDSINLLRPESDTEIIDRLSPGVYTDIDSFLKEINNLPGLKNHLHLHKLNGGFVKISRICNNNSCIGYIHGLRLSERIRYILGFVSQNLDSIGNTPIIGDRPANLVNGFPGVLMVYSDICEPYITGDTQTRLLRIVPLTLRDYRYGSVETVNFTSPMYIPLLSTSFRSIEIDIRDEHGNPISFDFGTLTVTLHFKRTDWNV